MNTDTRELISLLLAMLPCALPAYWILATFAALIANAPIEHLKAFRHAVQLSASRGKLWEDRPAVDLGPLTDATVPQSWFAHFYAVGAACNFACIWLCLAVEDGIGSHPHQEQLALGLLALLALQFHLLRRLYETIFVMKYPAQAKMHLIAYIFGLSYYMVLSLSQVPSTHLLGVLTVGPKSAVALPLRRTWQAILHAGSNISSVLGIGVFMAGNLIQYQSHHILASLASLAKSSTASQEAYRIPHGGLFRYVSCPHYLAEIIIYVGLLLMVRGRMLNAYLILLWVVSNLMLAARATHHWYRKKFEDYPTGRWALLPMIF